MENGTLLVSDEIHSDLIFHGKRHTAIASLSPEIAASVITCVSATKTFNLAGLQASTTIFPNTEMKVIYDGFWGGMDIHRNNAFSSVATYLMWLDCRDLGMNNEELRDFFIHKAKLGLNEGWTFGRSLSGYMRLNAACPRATLEEAMARLKSAIDTL